MTVPGARVWPEPSEKRRGRDRDVPAGAGAAGVDDAEHGCVVGGLVGAVESVGQRRAGGESQRDAGRASDRRGRRHVAGERGDRRRQGQSRDRRENEKSVPHLGDGPSADRGACVTQIGRGCRIRDPSFGSGSRGHLQRRRPGGRGSGRRKGHRCAAEEDGEPLPHVPHYRKGQWEGRCPGGMKKVRKEETGKPASPVRFRGMTTSVVTGGAGFLGSHLCDYLLEQGPPRDLRRQPRDGLAREHRARPRRRVHLRPPRRRRADPHRRGRRLRLPPRRAREPGRLPARAARVAEGRLVRHAQRARAREVEARTVPDLLDERGLRRPAGAPAAGDLLGQREPDRPARRLRRGEALCRGADDDLPRPAGRRHVHRAHLQHVRPAHAQERRPRVGARSSTRRSRASR